MNEIWKDVPEYEGLYQASTLGRVRSLDRFEININGRKRLLKGRVLKHGFNNHGYPVVAMSSKDFTVHKIILNTFVGPRPDGFCCMHLNDTKTDNRLINLKWGTYKENNESARERGLCRPGPRGKFGKDHHTSKPVLQLDRFSEAIINRFASATEAAKSVGISRCHISDVCRGRKKTAKGYKWILDSEA